eukprot:TRINITY_DN43030_c0_g1_i1.p1 TRINITY_DN43030_c0_g1~~TRINITY_DN43030_c0_g1_i1.p1  ORF type:complete len:1055 (+),score=360.34 TRINITY_DN43030_c0_g1_i1:58-3165(+)
MWLAGGEMQPAPQAMYNCASVVSSAVRPVALIGGIDAAVAAALQGVGMCVGSEELLTVSVERWLQWRKQWAVPTMGESMPQRGHVSSPPSPPDHSPQSHSPSGRVSPPPVPATSAPPDASRSADAPVRGIPRQQKRRPHLPPSVEGGVTRGKVSRAPRTSAAPPWLSRAGLPHDGSCSQHQEIEAFVSFVDATASERQARSTLRTSLQKLVQLLVCPDATLKVVGSWGTGLARFDSALDLVLEAPSHADQHSEEPCLALLRVLRDLGVTAEEEPTPIGTGVRVGSVQELSSALASWSGSTQRSHSSNHDFTLIVLPCAGRRRGARAASTAVQSALARFPTLKKAIVAIRSVMRQISGHLVALMAIAMLDLESPTVTPVRKAAADGDAGAILQEFFSFYSRFDWAARSVRPLCGPHDADRSSFPYKVHDSTISVCDLVDPSQNCTAHFTGASAAQLTGTLTYINMIITRYHHDTRGTSLLPNLVACTEDLQQRAVKLDEGAEVTKDLAVAVMRYVADYVEDRSNRGACESLMRVAAWDTMQNLTATKLQLMRTVMAAPNSPLQSYRGDASQLLAALKRHEDDPEVIAHSLRAARADPGLAVDKEEARGIAKEVADWADDPANSHLLSELLDVSRLADRTGRSVELFTRAAQVPGSRLSRFPPDRIPLLLQVLKLHAGDDEVRQHTGRFINRTTTRDMAVVMMEEITEFLEDPARADQKKQLMAQLVSEWSAGPAPTAGVDNRKKTADLAVMRAAAQSKPEGLLARFENYLEPLWLRLQFYNKDPQMLELRYRCARAAITREVAVAVAKDVATFLSDAANSSVKQEVMRAALCDTTAGMVNTQIKILEQIVDARGSRLGAWRGANLASLVETLQAYRDDPDVAYFRKQSALAAVTKDVAVAMAKAAADKLEMRCREDGDAATPTTPPLAASPTAAADRSSSAPSAETDASRAEEPPSSAMWGMLEGSVVAQAFDELADEPGSRLGILKGTTWSGGRSALLNGLLAFHEEPEVRELRRRAAASAAVDPQRSDCGRHRS